jgi:Mrp family chromosome partitioning ATPase
MTAMSSDLPLKMTEEGGKQLGSLAGWLRLRDDVPVIPNLPVLSFASEQYRNVAVQIEERVEAAAGSSYVLAVTSPEAGSGKTLTALNLALILSREGERRVLFIEADFYRPRLHRYFQPEPPEGCGFHQVLEGRLPLQQALFLVYKTGLDVLLAGTRDLAGDVLSARRLSQFLEEVASRYEIVVLDSPPLPIIASARVIADRSDGVLLVTRAGESKRRDIEMVLGAVGHKRLVGMVLNAARVAAPKYY